MQARLVQKVASAYGPRIMKTLKSSLNHETLQLSRLCIWSSINKHKTMDYCEECSRNVSQRKSALNIYRETAKKVSVLFIWENLFPSKLTRNIQTRSRWSYHRMFRINFNLLNTALWGWSRVDWNIGKGFPFASSSSLNAQCESRWCLPRDKKRIFYLASRLLFLLRRHIFEMIEDA